MHVLWLLSIEISGSNGHVSMLTFVKQHIKSNSNRFVSSILKRPRSNIVIKIQRNIFVKWDLSIKEKKKGAYHKKKKKLSHQPWQVKSSTSFEYWNKKGVGIKENMKEEQGHSFVCYWSRMDLVILNIYFFFLAQLVKLFYIVVCNRRSNLTSIYR